MRGGPPWRNYYITTFKLIHSYCIVCLGGKSLDLGGAKGLRLGARGLRLGGALASVFAIHALDSKNSK